MATHWILENVDSEDLKKLNDVELMEWAKEALEHWREMELYDLDDAQATTSFPRFGYTTAQVFEDWDSYREFKVQDINEQYDEKVEEAYDALKSARDNS